MARKAKTTKAAATKPPPTEKELKAKAVAPRVTLEQLEGAISTEAYMNGATFIKHSFEPKGLGPYTDADAAYTMTICLLVLKNGYVVIGTAACASPENFDEEMGRRIARAAAINQLWPLFGFSLRESLHAKKNSH